MKRLFLLSLIAVIVISCSKGDDLKPNQINPNALISIRPAKGVKLKSTDLLTANEIVKQTTALQWCRGNDEYRRGFADHQRDTINSKLLMYGTDVITQSGTLEKIFIEGFDMVLIRFTNPGKPNFVIDTIAYIENKSIRNAEQLVRTAFANNDFNTCYNVIDTAFKFIPCTGGKWRDLKKQGLN